MSPVDPASAERPSGHRGVEAALLAAFGGFLLVLVRRGVVFGSVAGHSAYAFLADARPPAALLVGLAGAVVLGAAMWASLRIVDRHPWPVVLAWWAGAFVFQLAVRGLYPAPLAGIVESDVCTSFYSPTLHWPPAELLRRFADVAPWLLPHHAASNMPGKIFVFYFLELFTKSPGGLALLIIALSNLGSAMLFLVAREWFGSARTGLLAFALSMLFPAKVGFLPLLNAVTPGFLLLSLWLWLVYLRRQEAVWLLLLGASLYLLLFVEPLPLVAGVIFLGAFLQRRAAAAIGWRALPGIAAWTAAGFGLVHAAMWLAFRFEILSVFGMMLRDSVGFNQRKGRPYDLWVGQDLKEFFLVAGWLPSLLYAVSLGTLIAGTVKASHLEGIRKAVRERLADPASNLLACFTLCLLAIDLLGVNRGEVARLWIFLGVLLQLVAADACLARLGERAAGLTVATVALQTAVTVGMVAFLIC
ncbi:MAG TPA: hypothetical protein VOA87_04890 [Thermoanaerobaculia bacterium]|nr:hypothetical protein [Thermoanaerobaculia bacterium]